MNKFIVTILFIFFSFNCINSSSVNDEIEFITRPQKKIKGDKDNLGCEDWILNEKDIKKLFKAMKKVSPSERHLFCYEYPCFYEAEIKFKDKKYKMIVNSASYIELSNKDETLNFILETSNKKFLIPCNCCE
ncbi:hypothetical protein [Flavobacterium terrisoli]|uniref:hypothetical protein n=1 Tax=Flavobacterium terrisoli TaxID=3242195 RepID=UPI002542B07D|nr:hypothetical protein [Flavobacterium buctense]